MPFKRSLLRYAHSSGGAHCCYIEDGETIITTGAEGDIRIWKGVDDDDPNTRCVGEFVLYHAYYDNRILVSTDTDMVQAYTYPTVERDGTEFRFTAAVTCIKVNDKYIAACSEDMTIKVVPRDKSAEFFELIEHEGPVLRIDLSVQGLLASASGDGTIKIWNLEERKVIKTITGLDKIKSYQMTNQYASPSFEPKHGKYMAYNIRDKVLILDTISWNVKKTLKEDGSDFEYSVCSYSPCGKYICAGGVNGEISIWDIDGNRLIKDEKRENDAQCVTAIQWNPLNNGELAYMDNTGQFGLVTDIFDSDNNILERDIDEIDEVERDVDFGDTNFTDDDDEDGDNENCVSLERLKNETMRQNIDNEIDDILDGVSIKSGAGDDGRESSVDRKLVKAYPMQAPFQPGSTWKSLEHRYMLWNHVGIVRAHKTDQENSIEVEFHDSSVHHGIHITNYLNHTMASLSTTVLALCCEDPSKLVCIALGGSGGSREWAMTMPNCEQILCVAASEKLVTVATDNRYLRLFSAMGTQREVLSLPGPIIALSAHADRILAAYHTNAATEDQHISLMLIQTFGLSSRCRNVRCALTPGSKLSWIGYTDKGTPVTCDSMGMVRLFSMRANHWMPICDTSLYTKGASDSYFITDVSEAMQIVRGILCRGSAYPLTIPKPMVSELKMQIPLCDLEAEQSQLEETLVRYENFYADDSERIVKENAIKLFAIACRSEMEARAKELIEMLASPHLLPLAIKYASKLGRIHLAEKLGELLPQFKEQEKAKEQYDESDRATDMLLDSPATENLIQAHKDKYASPSVIPRPLSVSQLKRNPFKKTPQSAAKQINNPLKHLTDNVAGYDSQDGIALSESNDSEKSTPTPTNGTPDSVSENTNPNQNATQKPTFFLWYKENRADFQSQRSDLSPADLTKFAMNKYKQLFPPANEKPNGDANANANANANTNNDTPKQTNGAATNGTVKRKIADGQSGISKLARFNFSK